MDNIGKFTTMKNILDNIDFQDVLSRIASIAKTIGRTAAKLLLCLYYVLKDGDLTTKEKMLIYAALIYVLVPGDILPRKVFHLIGLTDDAVAVIYVYKQIKKKITPQILQKVEMQLDKWFGYNISFVDEQ